MNHVLCSVLSDVPLLISWCL